MRLAEQGVVATVVDTRVDSFFYWAEPSTRMSETGAGMFRRGRHTPSCVEIHQIGQEARWIAWVEKSYTESGQRERGSRGWPGFERVEKLRIFPADAPFAFEGEGTEGAANLAKGWSMW